MPEAPGVRKIRDHQRRSTNGVEKASGDALCVEIGGGGGS
jgi:hypothetical protein